MAKATTTLRPATTTGKMIPYPYTSTTMLPSTPSDLEDQLSLSSFNLREKLEHAKQDLPGVLFDFLRDRFGPIGGGTKTSFQEPPSTTRRVDNGDDAPGPDDETLGDNESVKMSETETTTDTTTATTTMMTTTTTATTTKMTTTKITTAATETTNMPDSSPPVERQNLQLAPPFVKTDQQPQSQVWPVSVDSRKKYQDYYDDKDDYYYDDEYYEDGEENMLKANDIDDGAPLMYFSRERLQYKTPQEENSLGPAVPLYSLKRKKNGLNRVKVGTVEAHQKFGHGVAQSLPHLAVPVLVRVLPTWNSHHIIIILSY